MFRQVCSIYIDQLNRPDLAVTLAGSNIGRLNYVVNILDKLPEYDELAKQNNVYLFELLISKSKEQDAPAWIFARLLEEHGLITLSEANKNT